MSDQVIPPPGQDWAGVLKRKNVLAGLMFVAVAILGLWLSRNYPIGTALRMGTGYVPRLLCWALLFLGVIVVLLGTRGARDHVSEDSSPWRSLIFVPASLVVFALTVERLGLVIACTMLIFAGGLAGRNMRIVEVAITAAVLVTSCVAIFVWGLGLPISVWPEW